MYSISFPKMFSSTQTLLIKDHKASLSNLKLLLLSVRTSLLGDPYFGTVLQHIIFEQNNAILRDLIIDEIYTSIQTFMPQLQLSRENIKVSSDGTSVYATINCINLIDYVSDMYTINLTKTDEVEE